jgi:hypothetical protein
MESTLAIFYLKSSMKDGLEIFIPDTYSLLKCWFYQETTLFLYYYVVNLGYKWFIIEIFIVYIKKE